MTLISETLIAEEAFIERFLPLPNPLNPHAALDFGDGGGCLSETFGCELEAIQQARPEHIWTLLDCDGELLLVSSCHVVNRLGYVLCFEPVPSGESFILVLGEEGGAA